MEGEEEKEKKKKKREKKKEEKEKLAQQGTECPDGTVPRCEPQNETRLLCSLKIPVGAGEVAPREKGSIPRK